MTTCNNCYINGDCKNCKYHVTLDLETSELEIENHGAKRAINSIKWAFAWFVVVAAIGIIIATNIYL
jgi:hypothetical protein